MNQNPIMNEASFRQCKRWGTISLLNFVIVAFAGVILRYKIAFSLPIINYKYLLNAHSHFAFSGWVSMAIFTAFVYILSGHQNEIKKRYWYQFNLAQIANFGMLLSFLFQGYSTLSIGFSILFILFSYWFAWQFWKDLVKSNLPLLVKYFARLALFFLVISSIGFFLLGYVFANKIQDNNLYHNSLYFFLHFQYNGWFSFAILTIFFQILYSKKIPFDEKKGLLVFKLFATACIPAYCLSLLWANPAAWIYILAAIAGVVQLVGAGILIQMIFQVRKLLVMLHGLSKTFLVLSLVAFSIKLLLQAFSAFPFLNYYATGIRPVVIGYLHLVLLGFISFFLLGYFFSEKLFRPIGGIWKAGPIIFIIGVLANEIFLLIQGLSSIMQTFWSSSGIWLFAASILVFLGLVLLLIHQLYEPKLIDNKWHLL